MNSAFPKTAALIPTLQDRYLSFLCRLQVRELSVYFPAT
jgi:hypothetical protein